VTRAFVFPGQGSQKVGMGRELAAAFPAAREVFAEVDEALSQKLSQLMFEGPEDELVLTANAQPALMAVSLAVLRVLEHDAGLNLQDYAAFVAGHSLGEYSALAAARAFDVAVAARLLKQRGSAMQRAVPVGMGAMAALLGLELRAVREVAAAAAQGEVCDAANDNAPGQVVISGHRTAVERALPEAAARGAQRAIMLAVSAPFHCALMAPAAAEMAEALAAIDIAAPIVPLVANVTATPVRDPATIRRLLVEQVTSLVRWRESVLAMKQRGVTELVEIGAGKVLSGLAKRIDRTLTISALGTPADIDVLAKSL
jgi:[acyl-carrier-protein] S-malonyltransferase